MNRTARSQSQALTGTVLALALSVTGVGFAAQGKSICEATVDCINAYSYGDTLDLPSSIVKLSDVQGNCPPALIPECPSRADTVSILLIIDQSGSMKTMDSNDTRYDVARKLIDDLAAKSPTSEVGIAIFSNQLMYNYQTDPFFTQFDPASGSPEAYVPLTRLNTTIDGMTAANKLKQVLSFSTTPSDTDAYGVRRLAYGFYGPTGRHDGFMVNVLNNGYNGTTDISLAFEAAKKAFLLARYSKSQQRIVFFSDGEPGIVDAERQAHMNDWAAGQGVPATFTAYFIHANQPIPPQVQDMVANIAANGYSTSNPRSEVWKIQRATEDIFQKLAISAYATGCYPIYSRPLSLTINGSTTAIFPDTVHALFPAGFPLQGPITTFDVSYTFQWIGLPPFSFTNLDSTQQFKLVVRTNRGGADSAYVTTRCWEQGVLKFFYQGVEIVSAIRDSQFSLEVRYYPPVSEPVNSATIKVTNSTGADSLTLTASDVGSYFTATFTRAFGNPALDNILQTGVNDSIIAIYRNPGLPLDVVRASKPVGPQAALRNPIPDAAVARPEAVSYRIYDTQGRLSGQFTSHGARPALSRPVNTGVYIAVIRETESRADRNEVRRMLRIVK